MGKKKKLNRMKHCPRCNAYFGSATLWKSIIVHWWQKKYYVQCSYCYWCGKMTWTKRGAIRKWNRENERKKYGKG